MITNKAMRVVAETWWRQRLTQGGSHVTSHEVKSRYNKDVQNIQIKHNKYNL